MKPAQNKQISLGRLRKKIELRSHQPFIDPVYT